MFEIVGELINNFSWYVTFDTRILNQFFFDILRAEQIRNKLKGTYVYGLFIVWIILKNYRNRLWCLYLKYCKWFSLQTYETLMKIFHIHKILCFFQQTTKVLYLKSSRKHSFNTWSLILKYSWYKRKTYWKQNAKYTFSKFLF